MIFKSYPEMENHSKSRIINAVIEQGHGAADVVWCSREKIHGTNFSFWYNGVDDARAARRTDFLEFADKFYDFTNIERRYQMCIQSLYLRLGLTTEVMAVYGEYAGIMSSGKWIQTGIEYGPQDFYAFDIMVDGVPIDDDVMESACLDCGMKTAPLLKVGTFKEVMEVPNDLQSVVMTKNETGTFEIVKGTDNIAEGYVAKPRVGRRFWNGARVAIKCKNEKWSETAKGKGVKIEVKDISDKDASILAMLGDYITENRLKNVLSKIGVPETKEFGKVMGMLSKDIIKDYESDTETLVKDADEPSRVCRMMNTAVGNFIRPLWVDICDGAW